MWRPLCNNGHSVEVVESFGCLIHIVLVTGDQTHSLNHTRLYDGSAQRLFIFSYFLFFFILGRAVH